MPEPLSEMIAVNGVPIGRLTVGSDPAVFVVMSPRIGRARWLNPRLAASAADHARLAVLDPEPVPPGGERGFAEAALRIFDMVATRRGADEETLLALALTDPAPSGAMSAVLDAARRSGRPVTSVAACAADAHSAVVWSALGTRPVETDVFPLTLTEHTVGPFLDRCVAAGEAQRSYGTNRDGAYRILAETRARSGVPASPNPLRTADERRLALYGSLLDVDGSLRVSSRLPIAGLVTGSDDAALLSVGSPTPAISIVDLHPLRRGFTEPTLDELARGQLAMVQGDLANHLPDVRVYLPVGTVKGNEAALATLLHGLTPERVPIALHAAHRTAVGPALDIATTLMGHGREPWLRIPQVCAPWHRARAERMVASGTARGFEFISAGHLVARPVAWGRGVQPGGYNLLSEAVHRAATRRRPDPDSPRR